jgi:20S proteasome alpha/beta subunit
VTQNNLDKIAELTSHSAMAVSGPNCDLVNFTEYVTKNLQLYELRNDGTKLSTFSQAHFCRNELAQALRRGPFRCNVLIGGYDEHKNPAEDSKNKSSLFWLDYLGTLHQVPFGCQGVAANFCLSVMDREYTPGIDQLAALKIIQMCIHELHTRFLPNQPNFIIKCIDKEGVKTVQFGKDPKDN